MSGKKLEDIVEYLSVLGLDTTKAPTMSEYREAYKKHFHLHPDKHPGKADAETTEVFQKITEAAHEVLEFLTAKGENQPESIEKTDVLSRFVRTNKVVYNKNCVTFYLTKDTVEIWKKEFRKKVLRREDFRTP